MPDSRHHSVVIGIGNPNCGDDGVGRAVARHLRGMLSPDIEILEHDGEAASLLTCLEGAAAAYLIDASASDSAIGRVRRFDVGTAPLPPGTFNLSTHGLGLAEAVELARALGQLPGRCIVYAIEGETFRPGAPLSPPVAAAITEAACRIRNDICGVRIPEGGTDA